RGASAARSSSAVAGWAPDRPNCWRPGVSCWPSRTGWPNWRPCRCRSTSCRAPGTTPGRSRTWTPWRYGCGRTARSSPGRSTRPRWASPCRPPPPSPPSGARSPPATGPGPVPGPGAEGLVLPPQVVPEAVAQGAPQVGLAAQGVLEQALRLHQQVLVHGAGKVGVAGQEFAQRLPAARTQPLGGDLRADEADVLAGGPARRGFEGGDGAPGDVGLEEVEVEGALAVDLPEQRLGLVAALGRLDAPEVDPGPVPLGGLDGGHQVLVAAEQGGVADRAVPGQ